MNPFSYISTVFFFFLPFLFISQHTDVCGSADREIRVKKSASLERQHRVYRSVFLIMIVTLDDVANAMSSITLMQPSNPLKWFYMFDVSMDLKCKFG